MHSKCTIPRQKKSQIFLGRGIALFQTPPHWGVTIPSIYSNTPYTYNYVLEKSAIMRYISLTFTSHHIIRTTIRPSWWHCSLSSDAIYRCSSQLREECISPVASILDNISTFLRVFCLLCACTILRVLFKSPSVTVYSALQLL